jgi:glutaconyl-CoA decarboxylase
MKPYFEKMNDLGKALTEQQVKNADGNVKQIKEVEKTVAEAVEKVKKAGLATEEINKRGEMTVYQRLEYLLDPGTWCPLHTLFDPMGEESGTTGVVDGLGRISGKWAVIIGFDNKVMAGAWIAGQSENILRVTDMAKRLHLPLVWLVNCSGVKLTEQEKKFTPTEEEAEPLFLDMLNWKSWASPFWQGSTEPILRVEGTRGSVRPSSWLIRTATSPSVVAELSAE